jgi:hypothetical protein
MAVNFLKTSSRLFWISKDLIDFWAQTQPVAAALPFKNWFLGKNAPVKRFLNRFRCIIACWKGLESRNSDKLQLITFCNALHVSYYKKENIAEKSPKILQNIA